MAGTTSSVISNLLSSLERLSQFMAASSSSSIVQEDVNVAEVNLIQKGLTEDLSRLWRMFRTIQTIIHDAEEREINEKVIQLWLSELREVAYDAEDVLDQYDYQVLKTQLEGITVIAKAEPSLKSKQMDADDDIYGYQIVRQITQRPYSNVAIYEEDSDDNSSNKGMAAPNQASLLLQKQLEDLSRNLMDQFSVGLVDNSNIFEWRVNLFGPPDTLYDGGYFNAIMSFPQNFPNSPPIVRFTSEMWHPNVYPDGRVCISILHVPGEDPNCYKFASERWTPVHTVKSIVLSIISMFSSPNDESPANVEAAKEWRERKDDFKKKVRRIVRQSQDML